MISVAGVYRNRRRGDHRLPSRAASTKAARQTLMDSLGGIPIGRPNHPKIAEPVDLWGERAASIHGSEYLIDGGTIPTV